jgi:hypothetical protein
MPKAGIRERIVPLPGRDVLDQLISEGRATQARGDLLDLKPIQPIKGKPRLTEVLSKMRADER